MAPTVSLHNSQARSVNADTDRRPLAIGLGVALPVVTIAILAALVMFLCPRLRRTGLCLCSRNTPVDDDEIESWKTSHMNEKRIKADPTTTTVPSSDVTLTHDGADGDNEQGDDDDHDDSNPKTARDVVSWRHVKTSPSQPALTPHVKRPSTGSVKKPPMLVVYHHPRTCGECYSPSASSPPPPHSASTWSPTSFKHSLDMVQTPVLARAPNSRPGLTDESIEGDAPYVLPPSIHHHRRQSSRLTKFQPLSPKHQRTRSNHSSTSTSTGCRHHWYGHLGHQSCGSTSPMMPPTAFATDMAHPARSSVDNFFPRPHHHHAASPLYPHSQLNLHSHHQRSDSASVSTSQRPSLDTNFVFDAPLGVVRAEDIGRAVG